MPENEKQIAVVHTVLWEDADWERLHKIGKATYHPGYPETAAELIDRIGNADIVIGADVEFSAEVLANCPNLKMISIWSTGYDSVDLATAQQLNILVANVPGYAAYSVAEQAWAMVLFLAKRLAETDAHVRNKDFDWAVVRGIELYGKTAGIIGTGAIGTHSVRIAYGFGMNIFATTKHPTPERGKELGVTFVSLSELFQNSDVILLHVPLTDETLHMIDMEAFHQMTKKPILVNTSRGQIVEMDALLEAMDAGTVSGFGADVMWTEPPDWESPAIQKFLAMERIILSPHNSSNTKESFQRLTHTAIDNIEDFLEGRPTNVLT